MRFILMFLLLAGCASQKKKEADLKKSQEMVLTYKESVNQKLMDSYLSTLLSPQRSPLEFVYLYELILDAQACSHYYADESLTKCENNSSCVKKELTENLYNSCLEVSLTKSKKNIDLYEDVNEHERARTHYLIGCMDYLEKDLLSYNKIKNYNSCVCAGMKAVDNPYIHLEKEILNCYKDLEE